MTELVLLALLWYAFKAKQPARLATAPATDANLNLGLGGVQPITLNAGAQVIPGSIQPTNGATQNAPATAPDSYGGTVLTSPMPAPVLVFDDGVGALGTNPGTDLPAKLLPAVDPTVENTVPASLKAPGAPQLLISDQPQYYVPLVATSTVQPIFAPLGATPAPFTLRADSIVPTLPPDDGGGRFLSSL